MGEEQGQHSGRRANLKLQEEENQLKGSKKSPFFFPLSLSSSLSKQLTSSRTLMKQWLETSDYKRQMSRVRWMLPLMVIPGGASHYMGGCRLSLKCKRNTATLNKQQRVVFSK